MNREQRRAAAAATRRRERAEANGRGSPPRDSEVVEAAVRAAQAGDVQKQTITMEAPVPGTIEGILNVSRVVGNGREWIRIVSASAAGLAIIDLPIANDQGQGVAELVGATIFKLARQKPTGLVGPDGKQVVVADGVVDFAAAELERFEADVSRETSDVAGQDVAGQTEAASRGIEDTHRLESVPLEDDEGGRRGD